MMYEAITNWQAEDYEIVVSYGEFDFDMEARSFASKTHYLRFNDNELTISSGMEDVHDIVLDNNNVEVFKMKESAHEAAKSRLLTDDDYEQVHIPIEEFQKHPDLASFGSLAYGSRRKIDAREITVVVPDLRADKPSQLVMDFIDWCKKNALDQTESSYRKFKIATS